MAGDGLQFFRRLNQCASAGDRLALNRLAMARNGGGLQVYLGIKAAFDSVDRRALWKALRSTGVPGILIDLIVALHENTGAQVRSGNNLSNRFQTTSGVRQGCILAPALFSVAIDWILNHMSTTPGIKVGARQFTDLLKKRYHLLRPVCIRRR